MHRRFTIYTSPDTGTHVVAEPEGPPLAKFRADQKCAAESLVEYLTQAVKLAHSDRDDHPLRPLKSPPPTIKEARDILKDSLQRCGHVWLTGEKALETLTRVIK